MDKIYYVDYLETSITEMDRGHPRKSNLSKSYYSFFKIVISKSSYSSPLGELWLANRVSFCFVVIDFFVRKMTNNLKINKYIQRLFVG